MRLKSIKLAGFKSFADPTTVHLPYNMTAIVGPNGCGKSNVIDAVRWVMGESSAKNLRGDSMTDVIFNGTDQRKPVGQSSIELIFDNSDGSLLGEYSSYTEISVRRRLTRDGASDYFLNGTKCRRRDITDIFLGTGLGPRSYAIIEQGMISRLVEAKPEELRIYIEEAAGISKYKERRKDTESRIRRTKENLERLTDIRDELERQLERLKRQSEAAEKYKEFKKEERKLKAELHAIQWRDLEGKGSVYRKEIGELEVSLEAVHAKQSACDTDLERYRNQRIDLEDQSNKVQQQIFETANEITRIEQTIHHQQERESNLKADLAQTDDNLKEATEHLQQDTEALSELLEEFEELSPRLEEIYETEQTLAEQLVESENAMQRWQSEWDHFNQGAAEPQRQAEVQQSRIQHIDEVLQRLKNSIDRLKHEQTSLDSKPLEEEKSDLLGEVERFDEQSEVLQEKLSFITDRIDSLRVESSDAQKEQSELRGSLQELLGKQSSLEALQQSALDDGADTKKWLQDAGFDQHKRLADILAVEEGWEKAVETVLGVALQAVCVDSVTPALELIQSFSQGSVSFIATEKNWQGEGNEYLSAKIKEQSTACFLLAGIKTAASLDEARKIQATLKPGESVITTDGVWLGTNWLKVSQKQDNTEGVIARKKVLADLTDAIDSCRAKMQVLDDRVISLREALRQSELEQSDVQKQLQQQNQQYGELRSRLSSCQSKIEQIQQRQQRITVELGEAENQFAIEEEHLGEARIILQGAIETMEEDSTQKEKLQQQRDTLRHSVDTLREKNRQIRDESRQLAMRQQALQAKKESLTQSVARATTQKEQLQQRKLVLKADLQEKITPDDSLQEELNELLEKRLVVDQRMANLRQQISEIDHQAREKERDRHLLEQEAVGIRNKLEQVRLDAQSLDVRRTTLEEQLIESGFEITNVLESLTESAELSVWQQQVEKVETRIQRLGAINLAAIDEYSVQSERKNYLDDQNQDLDDALNMLEAAIKKIDKETRERFRKTFEKVNQGLQELFPKVFGGGSAGLELTGNDLLDTGVAIMARPPGKKNSSINLLSGGEKALTAIALVFSIFQLNPAPFCILDEVDAPLDDANVGRYANLVKEMSEKVQFIYITHNKISMEVADSLMGVTMNEPGVSRLVSVDVDAAAKMVEEV